MGHRSFTLECTPETFQARTSKTEGLRAICASRRDADLCKRLWSDVGAGFWTERSRWDQARWRKRLEQPNVAFWVAWVSGREAGCFELTQLARGVRMDGFGLLPPYRGRGLGRDLLTAATRQAFATGARRVWLHTATDDHSHALPNYLSGGYRIVRERELRNPLRPRVASKIRRTRRRSEEPDPRWQVELRVPRRTATQARDRAVAEATAQGAQRRGR